MAGRVTVANKVGADIGQKALLKAAELANTKYAAITGQPMTREQQEFLTAIAMNLTDTLITAVRTGRLKPMDVAQMVVGNALADLGLLKGGSAASNYVDCGLALVAFALTTVDMYGLVVTASAAAAVTAPETGGASLAVDAGVIVVGILFWNYMILDTAMRCAGDFKSIEAAVPPKFNVASQRGCYINACCMK